MLREDASLLPAGFSWQPTRVIRTPSLNPAEMLRSGTELRHTSGFNGASGKGVADPEYSLYLMLPQKTESGPPMACRAWPGPAASIFRA